MSFSSKTRISGPFAIGIEPFGTLGGSLELLDGVMPGRRECRRRKEKPPESWDIVGREENSSQEFQAEMLKKLHNLRLNDSFATRPLVGNGTKSKPFGRKTFLGQDPLHVTDAWTQKTEYPNPETRRRAEPTLTIFCNQHIAHSRI